MAHSSSTLNSYYGLEVCNFLNSTGSSQHKSLFPATSPKCYRNVTGDPWAKVLICFRRRQKSPPPMTARGGLQHCSPRAGLCSSLGPLASSQPLPFHLSRYNAVNLKQTPSVEPHFFPSSLKIKTNPHSTRLLIQ